MAEMRSFELLAGSPGRRARTRESTSEAASSKAAVLEDLDQGSVQDADGGDLVVESMRQRGTAVAGAHAEVVAGEAFVAVEAGAAAGLLGVSPLPLALLVAILIAVLGEDG